MSMDFKKLEGLLDKPLRQVIRECNTVYVNPEGYNLGFVFVKGQVARNIQDLTMKCHTKNGECHWEEITIKSATIQPIKFQSVEEAIKEHNAKNKLIKGDY